MKALLFSAGMGSRMRPLTDSIPKALVVVQGKTLLERNLEKLIATGVETIVVNIHYRGEQILDFLASRTWDADIRISDEREALLETGGGLLKAADWLRGDQPFFLYNVDILSTIDLKKIYQYHIEQEALATLAVRHRAGSRCFLWDKDNRLCGWSNRATQSLRMAYTPETPPQEGAFSGIHVASPALLDLIEQRGAFSITDAYLDLAARHRILAYWHDSDDWMDIGTPEKWQQAEQMNL